jgi:hypothetical protein
MDGLDLYTSKGDVSVAHSKKVESVPIEPLVQNGQGSDGADNTAGRERSMHHTLTNVGVRQAARPGAPASVGETSSKTKERVSRQRNCEGWSSGEYSRSGKAE